MHCKASQSHHLMHRWEAAAGYAKRIVAPKGAKKLGENDKRNPARALSPISSVTWSGNDPL
jgi:hypothetical protein